MLRAAAPMLYREFFDDRFEPSPAAVPMSQPTPDIQWDPLFGHNLSDRQRDVLRYLLRGYSEKEVANELGLSGHTIHTHVKRLYAEFEVSSRGELLALFVDRRLLDAA
jgi:DNA-binding CsgD family transcriptional regulator